MPYHVAPALVIEPTQPQKTVATSDEGRPAVSPAAKKMIRDNGLEPADVYQIHRSANCPSI